MKGNKEKFWKNIWKNRSTHPTFKETMENYLSLKSL